MGHESGMKRALCFAVSLLFFSGACARDSNVQMELFYPGEDGQSELPENAISASDPNVHIRIWAPHYYDVSLDRGWIETCETEAETGTDTGAGTGVGPVDITYRFQRHRMKEYLVHIPSNSQGHHLCDTRLWLVATLVPKIGSSSPRTVTRAILIHVFP